MSIEHPGSVTAASVLSIFYGIVGILWGLCGLAYMWFHETMGGNSIPGYHIVQVSAIFLELVSAIALLAAAIGLLGLKRWARLLAIVFAALGLAAFSFQSAYQVLYVLPAVEDALRAAEREQGNFAPMFRWFRSISIDLAIGFLIFFAFEILHLAIILFLLLTASARRAFHIDPLRHLPADQPRD